MARVTEGDVRAIYDTSAPAIAVNAAIDAANGIVTRRAAGSYSTETLRQMEQWLSAHVLAHGPDPTEAEGQSGDQQARYEEPSEILGGLDATRFGRMVLQFDTEGVFSATPKADAAWDTFGADSGFDRTR